MIGLGVDDLEPMSALAALGKALVDVEVGEMGLVFLAKVTDETPVVHGWEEGRFVFRSGAHLERLQIPRIVDARKLGQLLELLNTDGVLQIVGERDFGLPAASGGAESSARGHRGQHGGLSHRGGYLAHLGRSQGWPQNGATSGSETSSRHF